MENISSMELKGTFSKGSKNVLNFNIINVLEH